MPGLSDYGAAAALSAVLPNGTDVWIALFTELPNVLNGTAGVEAEGSGYQRIDWQAWVDVTEDDVVYRRNDGAIEFGALSDALPGVVGWGIYDEQTDGNLLAFGYVRDVAGTAVTKNFVAGNQPRFLDQELSIGIE